MKRSGKTTSRIKEFELTEEVSTADFERHQFRVDVAMAQRANEKPSQFSASLPGRHTSCGGSSSHAISMPPTPAVAEERAVVPLRKRFKQSEEGHVGIVKDTETPPEQPLPGGDDEKVDEEDALPSQLDELLKMDLTKKLSGQKFQEVQKLMLKCVEVTSEPLFGKQGVTLGTNFAVQHVSGTPTTKGIVLFSVEARA